MKRRHGPRRGCAATSRNAATALSTSRTCSTTEGTTSLAASTSVTSISGSPAPHPARDRHPFDHAIELIG